MLVQVEASELTFLRNAQRARRVHGVHEDQGNAEGGSGHGCAPDELGLQLIEAAAVQKAGHHAAREICTSGRGRTDCPVAKRPRLSVPQIPLAPWTAKA